MMRISVVIAAVLWSTAGWWGCAGKERHTADTAEARRFAAAETAIEHLRKQVPVDWRAVRKQVDVTLPLIRRADAGEGTSYAVEITAAMDACTRDEQANVRQQVIAKGLQHVAVIMIRCELDRLSAAQETRSAAVTEAYFEGIRPTFARRDRDFFNGGPILEQAADNALAALRHACENRTDIVGAARELEDSIARTYALSVLYEVQEIAGLRDNDPAACDVKRMEAVIFYRIIADRIKRISMESDRVIRSMLAAEYTSMDAAVIREQLAASLPGIQLQ